MSMTTQVAGTVVHNEVELRVVVEAMREECGGNVHLMAKRLGLTRFLYGDEEPVWPLVLRSE